MNGCFMYFHNQEQGRYPFFEELDTKVKPIKVMDEVWVNVTNVPQPLKAFLPLWVLGFLIGATQKVDMVHLRQTGEVCFLVAVFYVKNIPKEEDICVNKSIYRIFFKPIEMPRDDSFDPADDDLLEHDTNTDFNEDVNKGGDDSGVGDSHKGPLMTRENPIFSKNNKRK
jgi:hypothetical protein